MADQINLDKYLAEGKEAFTAALTEAKAVAEDGDAMQDEVNDAWRALLKAMSELRLKPDKSALETLIKEAQGLDTTGSSESDVAALTRALATAMSVFENEEATKEEVTTAANDLEAAVRKIQASTGETGQAGQSGTGSAATNASGKTDKNAGNSSQSAATNNKNAKSAKTGDMTSPAAAMAAFALAAAAGAVALKRKKEEE